MPTGMNNGRGVPCAALVAVAADGHPLTEVASPVDVSDHLNIVIADPTDVTAGVDFGVGGPRTWRVADLETKRRLIISGLGWGSMQYHHVKTDLETGRLIRISPQGIGRGGETPMPVYLIRRRELSLGPAAECFRRALSGTPSKTTNRFHGKQPTAASLHSAKKP